ncbi:MAG TPA: putative quinol monooxygenase [Thermomicrobiales bacterium]|jgi:autoinducer 2-degrading protein
MYSQLYQADILPERREDFRRLARQLAEESLREEPGTVRYHLVQDESNENRFYAFESYTDLAAMEAHMHGDVMGRNMEQLAPMLAAPPVKLGGGFDVFPPDVP